MRVLWLRRLPRGLTLRGNQKTRRPDAGATMPISSARVRLDVGLEQLANRGVRVPLRSGQRRVSQEFLNRAKVRPIGQQMRGERMPQGMRMQIPIYVSQTRVFFDDARHRPLRQPRAQMVKEHGLPVAPPTCLAQHILAQRLVGFESLFGFSAVRDDTLLVA